MENVLSKLRDKLEHAPKPEVDRILVDGEWAAVQFHTTAAKAVSGYDFSMQYCWLLKVEGDKIVEVVGFLDQIKIKELLER